MKSKWIIGLGAAALVSTKLFAQTLDCAVQPDTHATQSCFEQELRASDRTLNTGYSSLMDLSNPDVRAQLRTQQREWLEQRNNTCHLNTETADREIWLADVLADQMKTICVIHYTNARIATLRDMQAKAVSTPATVIAESTTNPPDNGRTIAYDKKPVTLHSTGKWYFEATLNVGQIAKIMPTTVAIGLLDYSDPHSFAMNGTMKNIQAKDGDLGLEYLGIAADLDNGKVYIRKNGVWTNGLPGSNQGSDIKLGRNYHGSILVSAKEANQKYFDSGAIASNFGDKPMVYTLPDGYLPWRASNPNDSVKP